MRAMTTIGAGVRRLSKRSRPARARLILAMLSLSALILGAVVLVGYLLWPRWPASAIAFDAPSLPIVVGGMTFDVPPSAIRRPVQRRAGAQERIDLAFLWPSLAPPGERNPVAVTQDTWPEGVDRIFVTVSAADGELAPIERFRNIYPRYVRKEPSPAPPGLISLAFVSDSPYAGEDLIYDFDNPEGFFVRCTRGKSGLVPGTCLYEEQLDDAAVTIRFPRAWLSDWHGVNDGFGRLIAGLRPKGG